MHLHVLSSTIQQPGHGSNLSVQEIRVDKEDVVNICNGICFSCNKKEILTTAVTWMDLQDTMLSEVSQGKTNVRSHLRACILSRTVVCNSL